MPAKVLGHDRYGCDNDMVCGWAGSLAFGVEGLYTSVVSGLQRVASCARQQGCAVLILCITPQYQK